MLLKLSKAFILPMDITELQQQWEIYHKETMQTQKRELEAAAATSVRVEKATATRLQTELQQQALMLQVLVVCTHLISSLVLLLLATRTLCTAGTMWERNQQLWKEEVGDVRAAVEGVRVEVHDEKGKEE